MMIVTKIFMTQSISQFTRFNDFDWQSETIAKQWAIKNEQ